MSLNILLLPNSDLYVPDSKVSGDSQKDPKRGSIETRRPTRRVPNSEQQCDEKTTWNAVRDAMQGR